MASCKLQAVERCLIAIYHKKWLFCTYRNLVGATGGGRPYNPIVIDVHNINSLRCNIMSDAPNKTSRKGYTPSGLFLFRKHYSAKLENALVKVKLVPPLGKSLERVI